MTGDLGISAGRPVAAVTIPTVTRQTMPRFVPTAEEVQEQPQGGPFGLISSLHGGGRGRRERGHRATLVPGPVSSHTDMVRPQILR